MLRKSTVHTRPRIVYIQCGTNDLERTDYRVENLINRLKNIINLLSSNVLRDGGEIVISSILPRSDNIEKVNVLNNSLTTLARSNSLFLRIMNNSNISAKMLTDKKHLNFTGFRTLLANIRFTLFGNLPKSFSRLRNTRGNHRGDHSNVGQHWL